MARAKYEVEGLNELKQMLREMGRKCPSGAAKYGLFEGAAIIADAINKGAEGIQSDDFKYAHNGNVRNPSNEEKEAIVGKCGIGKMKLSGSQVKVSVGYNGYCNIAGRRKAIAMIARSINKGTSFMRKQAFANKAVSTDRKHKAQEAIVAAAEKHIDKFVKNNER